MKTRFEALIVAGGGLTSEEELTERAIRRMDTAISAWQEGVAQDMVVSGRHSFTLDTPPSISEASAMKRYGLAEGVLEEAIHLEDESLDTIGNALFTKMRIVVPHDWEHLIVVTSRSHLPRTLRIFQHIMGNDFDIQGIPTPESIGAKEKVYEAIGMTIMKEVLRGTKPGDDEAIRERLFDLVPGYAQGTVAHLATQSLLGTLKRH